MEEAKDMPGWHHGWAPRRGGQAGDEFAETARPAPPATLPHRLPQCRTIPTPAAGMRNTPRSHTLACWAAGRCWSAS